MSRRRTIAAPKDIFRDLSLKGKLIIIFVISIMVILGMMGTIITINEIYSARKIFISDSEGIMRTVGTNSAAALMFQNRKDAEDTIRVLRVFPDVKHASVTSMDGGFYAEYNRDDAYTGPPADRRPKTGHTFSTSEAQFAQAILLDNEQVGKIYLVRDLTRFYSSLYKNVGIVMFAIFASLIIGYLLSIYFQRVIRDPITELLGTMRTVTAEKRYGLRADITGKDEIGELAHGFNEMLEKIEERDAELIGHRQHLEEIVRKRTGELIRVNEDLTHELEERRKFERALQESEERYRAIFQNTGNASVIIEENGIISLANEEFSRLTGYELDAVVGKLPWTAFTHPDHVDRMVEYHALRRMGREVPSKYAFRLLHKSGRVLDVHVTVGILPGSLRSIASIVDLTESKALEEQLLQSQKMEAVGQLAAGVAHDFNNILTAIIGYGNLLQLRFGQDTPERTYADSILGAAERAASLTQGLLAYGRKQVIAPKNIDLNVSIRSMEGLLRRMIGEDIDLRCMYADHDIPVLADSGQIGQVVMNLGTNARDAMPHGGVLTMSTSTIMVEKDRGTEPGMAPGPYALLKVSDVGQGMTKEVAERIFEPFFTTKGMGKSTGLGLSIVYGIVSQHSGHIHVQSEPGKGTVFSIYFPLIDPGPLDVVDEKAEPPTEVGRGRETILIAEDDETVRKYMTTVLSEFGYIVIEAPDGEDALKIFETRKDDIDLLLLDVVMPRMNGKVVYDNARKLRPGVRTIFMSGYTADIIHKKGLKEEGINFISKPVVIKELLGRIRSVLDDVPQD